MKMQDGSEYQDMVRRLEIRKKKDDKEEADKIELVCVSQHVYIFLPNMYYLD